MLTELRIRGIGVIEDTTLDFAPGFTALTGETGAGKTMVITGLTLLLGARLDAAKLHEDLPSSVEGRLRLREHGDLARHLVELGAALDDDELLLARRFTADARSRAAIGGAQVPVAALREIGSALMTLHGQSDQVRLTSPERQREALDAAGGTAVTAVLTAHAALHREHRDAEAELADLRSSLLRRDERIAHLRTVLDRLEAVAPQPGELDDLTAEENRLAHAETLREASTRAAAALSMAEDEPTALMLLTEAGDALETAVHHDPELGRLADRVRSLQLDAQDVAGEVSAYAQDVEIAPGRLAAVQQRRAELTALLRDLRPELDDAATLAEFLDRSGTLALELVRLEEADAAVDQLTARVEDLTGRLRESAATLTALRRTAAEDLSARITGELARLMMDGAEVRVAVEHAPIGPTGADRVEFRLRPHPGAPFAPIAQGASGGELSRVMLALEVALATGGDGPGEFPTFVFDEIDAGVGGRAASAIGDRLAELARSAQVIVVTHLPQVAAHADHHLSVRKHTDGSSTVSTVEVLAAEERVHELARMLAGSESAAALEHARELLEKSASMRSAEA